MGNIRFVLHGSAIITCIVLSHAVNVNKVYKKGPITTTGVPDISESPSETPTSQPYFLLANRLDQIRSEFLYPFYDEGNPENIRDYQKNIRDKSSQAKKTLDFSVPFYGNSFNYIWVSLHGYLAFSEGPSLSPTYPLQFNTTDYPKQPDPAFIGPFYSKCKIGELAVDEMDSRSPGVYFRVESNLMCRTDRWDIREGIVGAERFEPRHVIITTWKNVTYTGSWDRYRTNTFQAVLVTDETKTYVIFNYQHIGWTAQTVAGGSSDDGTGGTPAFVGFNAGNGAGYFEYKPYSQSHKFLNILTTGNVNEKPGRHMFRVDENIMRGQCVPEPDDMSGQRQQLTFAPESGKMLGGTIIDVTGPCFEIKKNITCRFNKLEVAGGFINQNLAKCVMPPIDFSHYTVLNFKIHVLSPFQSLNTVIAYLVSKCSMFNRSHGILEVHFIIPATDC